jgi:acyl-CoA synthetase (NDP forming)
MLFAPRSVAIIGASDDPSKTTSRPLQYLRNNGFSGTIYPVNPRSQTVLGERAFASVEDVPAIPDHAFILLPAEAAIEAVVQCGRRGVKVATILASGFSESGTEGQDRETRLKEAARAHGVRLIGPSSLGIVNLHHSMVLTANAAFAESGLMRGGIFCASQSGSMIGALLSRGKERGIGFASLVSVGGELDLGIGDLCEAGLEDPNVTGFMLFLENLRNAAALRRFAAKAAAAGKPVTALKLGRSAAAAELAVSHTGALSGEDDVADAFLADCGIARVETLDGLIEAAPLLARVPVRRAGAAKPRVAVVTTTGGGAAMVVDQLGIRGIAVEPPDDATLAAIRATGIDVAAARIVDLTLAGVRYEIMKGALEALLASQKYDLVIAVVGSSSRFQPELAVRPIIDVANKNTPLAAFMVPEAPQALKMLGEAGIPAFRSPEALGDVVAAAFRRRPTRAEVPATPANRPGGPVLDEMEGYGLLDLLGVSHARAITVGCETQVVSDKGLTWPVAVKILHAQIPHKSDVGGVVLNIRSDQEFADAARRIVRSVSEKKPDLAVERLLVQEMTVGALGEVLVGYRVDPQVGGMVLLAAGGVMTEIYRDRSLRIAPIDRAAAYEMLDEVKIVAAFKGFRGRPAGDLEALADTLVAVSRMAASGMPVVEFEINPLLVLPAGQGVRAVDVLVRLAPEAKQERP